MKRTAFRREPQSPTALCKDRIQSLLRGIVIIRDGGCILRHYVIGRLQERRRVKFFKPSISIRESVTSHAATRSPSYVSVRDIHGFFKPQYRALCWNLIRRHIGDQRWAWLERVIADNRSYHMGLHEWVLVEIALRDELAKQTLNHESHVLL
jgi:hypothetical protein